MDCCGIMHIEISPRYNVKILNGTVVGFCGCSHTCLPNVIWNKRKRGGELQSV